LNHASFLDEFLPVLFAPSFPNISSKPLNQYIS